MEWYFIVLIVVASLLLLYLILAWIVSTKLLELAVHPVAYTIDEARDFQTKQENWDFNEYDNLWKKEDFSVKTFDGLTLRGEVIVNPQESKRTKVAIICHGYTWNRITSLKYGKIFYDNGYNLIIYDHRRFGLSDNAICTLGFNESDDLSKVMDYARERFGKDAFLALHGESMGAATVLTETSIRTDIDFIVADCPFSDTMSYFYELCKYQTHLPGFPIVNFANWQSKSKYGYDFCTVSPIKDVENTVVPICYIHGTADKFINCHHSVDMFGVTQNPLSELHLVEDATHARCYLKSHEKYTETVTAFIKKIEKELY